MRIQVHFGALDGGFITRVNALAASGAKNPSFRKSPANCCQRKKTLLLQQGTTNIIVPEPLAKQFVLKTARRA
jgi:hypothetical protein